MNVFSGPTRENTPEWDEWLVCALHSYESSYLQLIFSWEILYELRAESHVSAEWRERALEEEEEEEEEKAAKGKVSRSERGGNYSGPKYCCLGKGSVVILSFSYLRVM